MNNEHIQLMEQTSFFPIIVQLLPQLALPLVMKAMETMDARIENVTFKNIQSVQARSPSIALPPLVSLSTRPRASVRSTFRSLVFCSLIFFARHRPLAPPLRLRFCPLVRLQRRLRITLRSKICLFVPLRSYRQLLLYSHNDNFYLATTWSVLRFEPLSRQTLAIVNQTLGDKHTHTLSFCNNLAVVLRETGASFQKPKWC